MTAFAHDRADEASQLLDQAVALVAAGLSNGSPAAGPIAAGAINPLTRAASALADCANDLAGHSGQDALVNEGRDLSNAAGARARELGFAQATPWPFIYAPLGAIYNAMLKMQGQFRDYASRVPIFLDPLRTAAATTREEGEKLAGAQATTWSPETFPWPNATTSKPMAQPTRARDGAREAS
jgi:hypothetical protein